MKLILAAFVAAAAFGQTGFEVASIKPSGVTDGSSSGITTGHGRLTAENVTLKRCIMGAWGIGQHQIIGGPDWLDSDRWMITAKADHPAGDHELMVLLQSLMTERFKLTVHQEKKMLPAYLLEVGKSGPKLEKSTEGGSSTNSTGTKLRKVIDARNTSMDQLAELLGRVLDLPVVNQTGLDGRFNFKLEWAPDQAREGGDADGPSIYTAVQEQLGLRLHADKAPVDVIVIDHVEMPSEN